MGVKGKKNGIDWAERGGLLWMWSIWLVWGKICCGEREIPYRRGRIKGLRSPREKFELHRVGEEVHLGFWAHWSHQNSKNQASEPWGDNRVDQKSRESLGQRNWLKACWGDRPEIMECGPSWEWIEWGNLITYFEKGNSGIWWYIMDEGVRIV